MDLQAVSISHLAAKATFSKNFMNMYRDSLAFASFKYISSR